MYLHFYTQFEVSWIGKNKWTAAAKPEHNIVLTLMDKNCYSYHKIPPHVRSSRIFRVLVKYARWAFQVLLTCSTSLSISDSEGKCFLTRSASLSFRSTMGPASTSPSLEAWTTEAEDMFSRTSQRKSAKPPEPASTSQGMEVFRERSTLWQQREWKGVLYEWKGFSRHFLKSRLNWHSVNDGCTSSMVASPDTSMQRTGMLMLPLPTQTDGRFSVCGVLTRVLMQRWLAQIPACLDTLVSLSWNSCSYMLNH